MTQDQIMHSKGYVTAAEAARALAKKSVSTVHRMATKGKLEAERVDIHWYISISSILAAVRGTPLEENARAVLRDAGVALPEAR